MTREVTMVNKTFLTAALLSLVSLSGCTNAVEPTKTQIYIKDGSQQCFGGGASKEQTEKELTDHGIKVYQSSCGTIKGMVTMAVCGGPTLSINVHTIDSGKLKQAEALGFKPVSSLRDGYKEGCQQQPAKPVDTK